MAVHLEDGIDMLFFLQEFLFEKKLCSGFDVALDDDLLVIGTVVLSILFCALVRPIVFLLDLQAAKSTFCHFLETFFDNTPVSFSNEMKCISVSDINFLELVHNLIIDQS